MNKVNWTAVTIFGIVVLLVFLVGVSLVGGWGYGGRGMMGPGMVGGWSSGPFGWFGMIFMWLILIGFITLTVVGVVWLVRAVGGGVNPAAPGHTCSSCGRGVQADWRNCPFCGNPLLK